MKLKTYGRSHFPRWTVHSFSPLSQTVRHVYRNGKRVDIQFEETWCGVGDIDFTRTYSWMDDDDRRQLQVEMPFLKKAEDLEQLGGLGGSTYFILHAADAADRSVLVILDVVEKYGIEPEDGFDLGCALQEVAERNS